MGEADDLTDSVVGLVLIETAPGIFISTELLSRASRALVYRGWNMSGERAGARTRSLLSRRQLILMNGDFEALYSQLRVFRCFNNLGRLLPYNTNTLLGNPVEKH